MNKYSNYTYRILWLISTVFIITCLYTLWGDTLPARPEPEIITAWQVIKIGLVFLVINLSAVLAALEHAGEV